MLKEWSPSHLDGFLKHKLPTLSFRVSDAVGLGRGLIMCLSRDFPHDIVGVGLGTTPGEHYPKLVMGKGKMKQGRLQGLGDA